jgi:hypothetical protein
MDARLPEGELSSQPDARGEMNGGTPSLQHLNDLMKGPRTWAEYFHDQLLERFPDSPEALQPDALEPATLRQLMGKLRSYEGHWPRKFTHKTVKNFQNLQLSEPDELAAFNELTFHVINQYAMSHWNKIFNSRNASRLDSRIMNAAQIKLALDSIRLMEFKQEQAERFEDDTYVDQQIEDIDTFIALLQLMIDAELETVNGVIFAPVPLLAGELRQPNFLAFQPTKPYEVTTIHTERFFEKSALDTPGQLAKLAIHRTSVSALSRWPEFDSLHGFMSAKLSIPKANLGEITLEDARQALGDIVRAQLS